MSIIAPLAVLPQPALDRPMPLRAGVPLNEHVFASIRRRMILDYCKWDPQVGDVSTLAPFPLSINRQEWNNLSNLAERLTEELLRAEIELAHRPELYKLLGIPRSIQYALSTIGKAGSTPVAVRTMRFDFHWTRDGWRISEVNSDVPGGFSEASELTRMMNEHLPGFFTPGDPGACWAHAMDRAVEVRDIALLAAPGFMEDQQVISYMARRLAERGFRPHQATPEQIRWTDGKAELTCALHDGPLGAIVRFYQGEWLTHLPRRCSWQYFFAGSTTPIANPGVAVLTESKRFPLVWDMLSTPLPTWKMFLPETRDPRDAPWHRDESWLLKTAFCNTGDTVTTRDASTLCQWRVAAWSARLNPGQWVAQKRFQPMALASSMGEVFPCVGVYTINGRTAGAYTRLSPRRIIDYRAIDATLLISEEGI